MPKQFKKAACFLTVLGLLTSFVFGAHSSYAMPKQKDAKQATKVLSNSELKTLDLDELGDIDDLDDLLLDIDWGFDFDDDWEELEQGGIFYVVNDKDEVIITGYSEAIDKATISIPSKIDGKPVTMIYEFAFCGLEKTKTINIPDSVKVIGAEAFAWCEDLQTINISNSVTTIDVAAFSGNDKLKTINIPNSVTELGAGAFILCENLTNVTLPNTISSIPYGTFAGCVSLKKIDIPSSVKTIEKEAFSMTGFTEFIVPDSVTTIGYQVFSDCENLVKVTIPKSVTTIGKAIFEGCSDDVTIYGEKGSYAETYANRFGIPFKAISSGQEDPSDILTGKTTAQLNVRKGSSTKYAKIGSLSKGAKVEIVSKLSNGWYKIKYKGTYGYVSGAYVKLDSEQPKPGEDEKIIATGKTTVSSLNVRSGPSSNYSKLGILTKGTKVEVVERYSNGWYKIKYKGSYGYVSGAYVSLDGSKGEVIATGKTTAGLNVRSGAGTGYKKIGHLNKGTKVEIVTKLSNGWYKIKFNSSYGYVSGDYVKLI